MNLFQRFADPQFCKSDPSAFRFSNPYMFVERVLRTCLHRCGFTRLLRLFLQLLYAQEKVIQSDILIAQCNACHLSHYMRSASWAETVNSCDD
jgi:hypothetical protein